MKQRIETYIKKCSNYQKNKHAIYVKYKEIQYQESSTVSWNEVIVTGLLLKNVVQRSSESIRDASHTARCQRRYKVSDTDN